MSKLIKELRLVSPASSPPMGFRAAAAPKPRILLVAIPTEATVGALADYMSGADAGIVPIPRSSSGAKTVHKISRAMPGIPWGAWLKDSDGEGIKSIVEVGIDFIIFTADMPVATLHDTEIGKILAIGAPLDEGLLKTIDDLPVDAVLISVESEKDSALSWRHLMLCQRCAHLVTKPLLASVPPGIGAGELQALWTAGVVGVVVETPPSGRIAQLRQIIDKLTLPPPSKRKKAEPLLPRISGEMPVVAEEEEE